MAAELQAPWGAQTRDLRSVLRVAGRTWWLVVGLAVLSGIGTVINASRGSTIYESRSVVTAISTPIPVENFEIALTLFATDEVIAPVADALGIAASSQQVLATRTLEADWVSGGGLEITSRSTEPEAAIDLANQAAESFATTLEEKGLGTFAVLTARSATVPETDNPLLAATAGATLGALVGLGLLVAGFMIRQPVVSEQDALVEFPTEKAYGVQVRLVSGSRESHGAEAEIFPLGIEVALLREARIEDDEDKGAVCCLLFEKSKRGDPAVRHLLARMDVLHRWFPQTKHGAYWIKPEDGVPVEALEKARTVFLIVSEGTRRGPLRDASEEGMVLTAGQITWILVFVKRRRRRRITRQEPARKGLRSRLIPLRRRASGT